MKKDIKDYLYLYIGCEIMDEYNNKVGKLVAIDYSEENPVRVLHKVTWRLEYSEVKPILRPLSDMTIEELEEQEAVIKIFMPDFSVTEKDRLDAIERINKHGISALRFDEDSNPLMIFEVLRLLLKQGFDLFGLIESGLAIDKTKLNEVMQYTSATQEKPLVAPSDGNIKINEEKI